MVAIIDHPFLKRSTHRSSESQGPRQPYCGSKIVPFYMYWAQPLSSTAISVDEMYDRAL